MLRNKQLAQYVTRLAFLAGVMLLAGCAVGPKYVRPTAEVPPDYKEAAEWKTAQPRDEIAKGKWWEIYSDTELNSLEEQVTLANQDLKAAAARFEQARAAIRINRAPLYPSVTANPSVSQNRQSQNQPLVSATSRINYTIFELPVDVSYEPDLWGRVRHSVEAARSEAQATAADLANVDLSLHAELAADYFQLRGLDSQKQLLDSTVVSYQKALDLRAESPRRSTWRRPKPSLKPRALSLRTWKCNARPLNTPLPSSPASRPRN